MAQQLMWYRFTNTSTAGVNVPESKKELELIESSKHYNYLKLYRNEKSFV